MAISTKEEENRTSKFAAVLKSSARKRRAARGAAPPPRAALGRDRGNRADAGWPGRGHHAEHAALVGGRPPERADGKGRKATDLVVSITEDGNVESAHNKDIKCELQGGGTILWLIKDGTMVKKGDELVQFDSSAIEDKISQQKITYEKARATMIEAKKNFEAAEIAVTEYLEGTYKQNLQTLEVTETVAKENLESAKNLLAFYNKMARNGYVTTLQRDSQAFAVERAKLDLDVAETAITVLEKFTRDKTMSGWKACATRPRPGWPPRRPPSSWRKDRLRRWRINWPSASSSRPTRAWWSMPTISNSAAAATAACPTSRKARS